MPERILVVEDDHDSLKGLTRLLRLGGYDVTAAADGRTALSLLQSEPGFDAILTDLMLPDVDGLAVAAAARRLDGRPVIVLATGDAQFNADDPSHRPLFDLCFVKPLQISRVLTELRGALRSRQDDLPGPDEPARGPNG